MAVGVKHIVHKIRVNLNSDHLSKFLWAKSHLSNVNLFKFKTVVHFRSSIYTIHGMRGSLLKLEETVRKYNLQLEKSWEDFLQRTRLLTSHLS